jgi:hypothetical protein
MPTENKLAAKRQRCEQVNLVIQIIANHGHRFFFSQSNQAFACMQVDDRGKVWFIDDYSQKRIYTHPTTWGGRWKGFSHGGTLKSLVEQFRDYICTGEQISSAYLGLQRSWDESNIWGYEEESMKAVREQAGLLPVFRPTVQEAA